MPYVDSLTEWDVDFGRKLWEALRDNRKFPTRGIFWLLESENGWRLVVATDKVDEIGRQKAYEFLAAITRGVVPGAGQPLRIELISPRTPLYVALRDLFKNSAVNETRLTNTLVGGIYVDDVLLYAVT